MISIGKMSVAAQTSVKTLRYYDRIGLLKPAAVDRDSKYRYYTADQIGTMNLINRCKRFGFSLQETAKYLQADSQQRNELLARQHQILEERIIEMETALRDMETVQERLIHKEENAFMQDYTVTAVNLAKQEIFGCRTMMGVGDFGEAFGHLFEEMSRKNIRPAGCNGARYYDAEFDHDRSDIEVFVPVAAGCGNGFIGGCLVAKTLHKGGYSSLNEGYAALVKWIEENGYEAAGAPFEIYTRTGYDRIPPAEWETEIFFPIAKKD
ncbi:MerR family transcriptional regulator [uncultured Faecalibaculum sp.]|uniref:MerR family transcriptional regulator n=1 Tax=uncultured Faecalibaculum sp. TaxID=1729681 RepID=UPI0025D4CF46|nr:MerR family transcriptional regulator [uncultured Faecalibaculum sp.]